MVQRLQKGLAWLGIVVVVIVVIIITLFEEGIEGRRGVGEWVFEGTREGIGVFVGGRKRDRGGIGI